ncbi:LrgB family protein [Actinobacillus pleuropneumoniae]|uniref:LrgB family protein n=1 Tax=Actinobacillus pleuropneumoniae TaxID=715 RepID=UPI002020D3E2|nr:LrgB family protein [Actinobacillus pleuropneumoniae]MCL7720509.1 LrgB family protein [Actinobacillus pleuropneumoniae]MCL7727944.1 LrgB family protein [Actinobacillus pleuropneumoniae]MCL7729704.1 LrgB family protein [Actinobacillus pleuropneumoniae]MCY6367687.1 LrgB family protein [Actinobacillus pleuropneumoniae]MCY6384555.1 LrgB family protein [Actinobacillus pleuropneumoniae]
MIYLYSVLTVVAFFLSVKLSKKLAISLLNPFLLTLSLLLAIVALAIPLYEQFPQIRRRWKAIGFILLLGTVVSICSGMLLALLFGGTKDIVAALMPKSVTMPLALVIAGEIGGEFALSAVGVMVAGLFGSILGVPILKLARITNPQAIGMSLGIASHALGTARCMEINAKSASYSSLALVICGLLSSFIAPLIFQLAVKWFM